jgi:GH15 family glucan-1,4-alpha-glucosidase
MPQKDNRYPPIADYALIGDCHGAALVSREGSVDWCCMPRVDSDSCFGRLLDWDKGGYCLIAPVDDGSAMARRYLPGTMVLETHFRTGQGEVRLYDFFMMDAGVEEMTRYNLVRLVEGVAGAVDMRVEIRPRFDYGEIRPGMRSHDDNTYSATGSNKGLIIHSDRPLDVIDNHDLEGCFTINAGQRLRLLVHFEAPGPRRHRRRRRPAAHL